MYLLPYFCKIVSLQPLGGDHEGLYTQAAQDSGSIGPSLQSSLAVSLYCKCFVVESLQL